MVVNALRMKCFKPPFWGQQTGQGKVSIIIDIRTNMPVCAFACRYAATYISCSQAEAVNTKRRLLHSYPTNCPTLFLIPKIGIPIEGYLLLSVSYCAVFRLCFTMVLWPLIATGM